MDHFMLAFFFWLKLNMNTQIIIESEKSSNAKKGARSRREEVDWTKPGYLLSSTCFLLFWYCFCFFVQVQKNKRQTSEFEVKDYFQLSFLQLINFLKKIMNLNQIESLLLSLVSPVLCPKRFIFLFSFNPLKLSILICFHSDWIYFLRPFNI